MKWILDRIGRLIAAYLQKPAWGYDPFVPAEPTALRASMKPGDILLIEGHNRISGIIEYLTRSTWSHAALYVGPISGTVRAGGEPLELIESNLNDGVACVPFVEILTISHPYLPTNRINIRRLPARMQLRGRKNWTSIRSQEFSGPRAIPPTVTFPAALATTNDRTWFR